MRNFHEELAEHFEKFAGHYVLMTQEEIIDPVNEETGEPIMPGANPGKPVTKAYLSGNSSGDHFFQQLYPLLETCELNTPENIKNALVYQVIMVKKPKHIKKIMHAYMVRSNNDGKLEFTDSINNTLKLMRDFGITEEGEKAIAIMAKMELVGAEKLVNSERKLLLDSLTAVGKMAWNSLEGQKKARGLDLSPDLINAKKTLDEMTKTNELIDKLEKDNLSPEEEKSLEDLVKNGLKESIRKQFEKDIPDILGKKKQVILGIEELKNIPYDVRKQMLDELKRLDDEEV